MSNSASSVRLPKNVWILTISQALILSVSSMVVFVGGLVGAQLTPVENLATLPVASIVVGTAVMIPPVALLMNTIGRRRSFFILGVYSVFVALLASYAISISSFYLFCFSTFLFGATYACVMQFRFASMESVGEEQIPKAASMVLVGGIAAAFFGPEIAVFGKDILDVEFAGSFILLAGLFIIAMLFLTGFRNPISQESIEKEAQRPLKAIFQTTNILGGYFKCYHRLCGNEFYNDSHSGEHARNGRSFTGAYKMGHSKSYYCYVFAIVNYCLDHSKNRDFKNDDCRIGCLPDLYCNSICRERPGQLLDIVNSTRCWLELSVYRCNYNTSSVLQFQRAF